MMLDVSELSNMLKGRAESVARYLLPGGKQTGREWEVGSVDGEQGKSLKVCISGSKAGIWSDFAAGTSGDLIDLWMAVKGLGLGEAIKEIKSYLGVQEENIQRAKPKVFSRPDPPRQTERLGKDKQDGAVMDYLTKERGLSPEVIRLYKVCETAEIGPYPSWKRQTSWKGPFITFLYVRDNALLGVKYLALVRRDGKKVTVVEPNCEPTCFGWHVIDPNARTLVICEGELDALSLYQYGYPAVSVPFGGGGGNKQQWIDYDWQQLEQFDTIYLCLDNDEEGQVAAEEITRRLGAHRCMIVKLPRKDANKCLTDGVDKCDVDNAFSQAKPIEPEELRNARAYYKDVLDEFYPSGGKLPGWDLPLEGIPWRFLDGEVTVITGVNGHGKSLLWGQLILSASKQGQRSCIASLEMPPKKTLYRMVRQSCGASRPRHTEVEECLEWMGESIWLFDLVGTSKVERLLEVFRYAFRRYGVRQFVIDSLMKCGVAEDDYRGQKDLLDKLCDFVAETGAHVHLIAHPRKADDETPPGKMDIKGTGAITDLAYNVFSLWRNKPKEMALQHYRETGELPKGMTLEEVEGKPDAMIYIHKSRNVEDCEGKWPLFYHGPSMRFLRKQGETIHILHETKLGEAPF